MKKLFFVLLVSCLVFPAAPVQGATLNEIAREVIPVTAAQQDPLEAQVLPLFKEIIEVHNSLLTEDGLSLTDLEENEVFAFLLIEGEFLTEMQQEELDRLAEKANGFISRFAREQIQKAGGAKEIQKQLPKIWAAWIDEIKKRPDVPQENITALQEQADMLTGQLKDTELDPEFIAQLYQMLLGSKLVDRLTQEKKLAAQESIILTAVVQFPFYEYLENLLLAEME